MKKYIFSTFVLLISMSQAGWHTTEEYREAGKRRAPQHPYASACVGICNEDSVPGSGVLVGKSLVATASHVVVPDDVAKENLPKKGPFYVTDGGDFSVWLGGVDAASKGRLDAFTTVDVSNIFFNPEADLAFLVLSETVPKQFVPAPVFPEGQYGRLVRKPFQLLKGTEVSGAFKGGLLVTYIGCGGTVVAPENVTKTAAQKAHLGAVDAQDAFTMGTLQASQRFSSGDAPGAIETIWGWMSLADGTKPWSSVLSGDSGAPAFIDVDGVPHVLGVVSSSIVSDKHDPTVVGTKICAFTGPIGTTNETWLQAFHRVRGIGGL